MFVFSVLMLLVGRHESVLPHKCCCSSDTHWGPCNFGSSHATCIKPGQGVCVLLTDVKYVQYSSDYSLFYCCIFSSWL